MISKDRESMGTMGKLFKLFILWHFAFILRQVLSWFNFQTTDVCYVFLCKTEEPITLPLPLILPVKEILEKESGWPHREQTGKGDRSWFSWSTSVQVWAKYPLYFPWSLPTNTVNSMLIQWFISPLKVLWKMNWKPILNKYKPISALF